jgi:hypothetical protein
MATRKRRSLDDQLAKQSEPAEVLPVAAAPTTKRNNQPGSRASKKAISGFFEMEVSRQLKIIAATEDKTIQGLLGEALNLLFEKYGKGAIAQSDE